jgi:hypothetical protein
MLIITPLRVKMSGSGKRAGSRLPAAKASVRSTPLGIVVPARDGDLGITLHLLDEEDRTFLCKS